jgi:hypothetical protein
VQPSESDRDSRSRPERGVGVRYGGLGLEDGVLVRLILLLAMIVTKEQ